jgi:hypothetical protein
MTCGVVEGDATPAMIGSDLAGKSRLRISPMIDTAPLDPCVDLIERIDVDEKCIMLHVNAVDARLRKLKKHTAIELDGGERPPECRRWKSEDCGEEPGRYVSILCGHDRVIEADGHDSTPENVDASTSGACPPSTRDAWVNHIQPRIQESSRFEIACPLRVHR